MLKKMMVFALMASATACATTYRVPQQEAPPEWREDGKPIGFAPVEGSARSFPGNLKEHGVIMEFDVENERTAIITNTLEWTGPFGGTNIIPAGSPAYARQFSLQQSSNYGSYFGKNLNAYNNPVEWCVPRFDKGDAVCIFWEGPDRARYIDTSGGTPQNASPMSPSGFQMAAAWLMPSPMAVLARNGGSRTTEAIMVMTPTAAEAGSSRRARAP